MIYSCLGTPNKGFGEVTNDTALCAHAEVYLRIAVMSCVFAAPPHELSRVANEILSRPVLPRFYRSSKS